ncbi:MAG: glycosyltransferase family 1 protein [Magnetococcales bacterium]|nr:glycosyltransferase family 1 protein [Magnetococcales bacterium]
MRLLMGFRRPFQALEEALASQGESLIPWQPGTPLPTHAFPVDGAVVDYSEAARHLTSMIRLTYHLRRQGAPLVAINRDAPWNKGVRPWRFGMLRRLGLLDACLTHALQENPATARRMVYFPNAAYVNRYHIGDLTLIGMRDPARYLYPVSFLGNIDAQRYREHRIRLEQLGALRELLAREGIVLHLFHAPDMTPARQVAVIQASVINLNLGAACDHGGARSWGLAERCYGIPACGGFLLSDARQHAREDFLPGEEWLDFDTLEGCVQQIVTLLADFPRTRRIAEAAHARVMQQHTYAHRGMQLRRLLAELKQERKPAN